MQIIVLTKGMLGACAYVLEQEGLLHFVEIFGLLGAAYGELDFDRMALQPSRLEGMPEKERCQSTASLIQKHMRARRATGASAVLVSCDPEEVESVASVCLGILATGLEGREMAELRRLCLDSEQAIQRLWREVPELQDSERRHRKGKGRGIKGSPARNVHDAIPELLSSLAKTLNIR